MRWVSAVPAYDARLRGPSTHRDTQAWTSLWPSRSSMQSGDSTVPLASLDASNKWSEWTVNGWGNLGQKLIIGICVDATGNVVTGATIEGFVTANNVLVNVTSTDGLGNYQLGTVYPGVAHYLVAYRAGSPDISGTTVNTLQGTNLDGT